MVSLPPMNPGSPSRVEPEAVEKQKGSMPEAVRYMLAAWTVMIGGELLHQILAVAASVIDPSALREVAKERATKGDGEVSEALMNASVYGSIFIMALLQLGIILLFVFALRAVQKQAKWAENARRLLQIFSVFFALRMLTLFMMVPASTAVPTALFGVDGVIQIVLGVAGVMGVIYSVDKDSVAWTKPPKDKDSTTAEPAEKKEH
ncbi:hypothetical protein CAFEA_01260 [Corynebacterium afermentans subsp. afermentans]|uniref:Uncharacterized protein n=2 Tax=Corynebacterium afermentans TaxID=38286 RepID=A0A9X8R350_9CORY|nr:hypothetical protein CAFEA_01260 [Corynebacterium afermentans subsp. afermentans]SIQ19754.1 hypothetical protein SAMN05421802_10856 [Corynebacterium afermentans]